MATNLVCRWVENLTPSAIMAASVGALVLLVLANALVARSSILPGVPKLKGYPLVGSLPEYLAKGPAHLMGRLIDTGGEGISYANVAGSVVVSVHEPAMVKEVLSLPDEIASREGDASASRVNWTPVSTLGRLIGNPALISNVGPETDHQRNVMLREFNGTKSNKTKFETILRIATEHCANLVPAGALESARIPDMRSVVDRFAISLWGDILYGNPASHTDGKIVDVSNIILTRMVVPWSAFWHNLQLVLGLTSRGQPTAYEAKIRAQVGNIIDNNVNKLHEYEAKDMSSSLLGTKSIRAISVLTGGSINGPLSKFASEFARVNLCGGHQSIGLDIVWTLVELGKNPEKLARLVAEIDSVEGPLDFDTVNGKMPYLDAVVTEVNRLYPPGHASTRVINKEVRLESASSIKPSFGDLKERAIPSEVVLKPGMMVYLSFLHINRSEEYWGRDAAEFVPQRFIKKHKECNGGEERADGSEERKLGTLMTYGYGPRNCVGYKFAVLAAKVYLIMLLKMFKLELEEYNHEMKLVALLEPSKPVAVRLTRRVDC
ncbi:putative cytochrome P450 [Rhypophila decipiens]|uniref:Cytochrome P450 n=1 Tax=Rhypophila decipiens TaxID=261697 RepID=A0AAN6YCI6_9PEZI|nr:putative cytochrome P450 [Rhypophila decipiens]